MAYYPKTAGTDRDGNMDSDIEAVPYDTEPVKRLKRERSGTGGKAGSSGPFVKGPIPVSWVRACRGAHTEALALALGIKARESCFPDGRVPVGTSMSRLLDLGEDARRRALVALEMAGLVEVVREAGKAPTAKLTPWSEARVSAVGDR